MNAKQWYQRSTWGREGEREMNEEEREREMDEEERAKEVIEYLKKKGLKRTVLAFQEERQQQQQQQICQGKMKKHKSIFVSLYRIEKGKITVYKLDIPIDDDYVDTHHDNQLQRLRHPIVRDFSKVIGIGKLVVMDSKLLFIGGSLSSKKITRGVNCFDLDAKKWEEPCHPNNLLVNVQAGIIDGKLFVFGDTLCTPVQVLMESFDIRTMKWVNIPNLPSGLPKYCRDLYIAAVEKLGIILVGRSDAKGIHAYNVAENSWYQYDSKLRFRNCRGPALVIGTTLYWLAGMRLKEIDLDTQKCRELDLVQAGVYPMDDLKVAPQFLHLSGNIFCLTWSFAELCNCSAHKQYYHPCFYCKTFKISHKSSGSLEVFVKSYIKKLLPIDFYLEECAVSEEKNEESEMNEKRKLKRKLEDDKEKIGECSSVGKKKKK